MIPVILLNRPCRRRAIAARTSALPAGTSRLRVMLTRSLLLLLLGALGPTAAYGACEEQLAEAEALYHTGAYADAISRVTVCFNQGALAAGDAVRGYRLLVLAYLGQDDTLQAKLAAVRLLALDFSYAPDPVQDPPDYARFINEVKRQLAVPGRCPQVLAEAEDAYRKGAYADAISRVTACFSQGAVVTDDAVRGYRLLVLAYLSQGDLLQAKRAVIRLMEQAPDYTPDPIQDPPPFTALMDIVRQQQPAHAPAIQN